MFIAHINLVVGVSGFVVEYSRDEERTWSVYGTVEVSPSSNSTATNASCVYVPYSTQIECDAELSVPSGYIYYVRVLATNPFGASEPGDSASVIAAGICLI